MAGTAGLVRNAFTILSESYTKIGELGVLSIDQEGTPRQPQTIQQLIDCTRLYRTIMRHIVLNDAGTAIVGVIYQDIPVINDLLKALRKRADLPKLPVFPTPLSTIAFNFGDASSGFALSPGVLGDLITHNGTNWVNLNMGNSGDVLVSTPTGLQWQSVVGNGIPTGGSSGQVLKKNSNTSYDVIWDTLDPTDIGVIASASELNILNGATFSTAEANTLVGINTGTTIQAQIDALVSTSLTQGYFLVGNASNEAAAVIPSGEVTFDYTGVFTIADLAINDANINTTANITRSKLATGSSYRVVVNDGTGVITDASAITANRVIVSDSNGLPVHSVITTTGLSYLDATSSIQTQLNNRLSFSSAITPVEGDIPYYNGSVWTNLAIGPNGYVLTSNGTTVSWTAGVSNGLPSGGTASEILRKIDGTDYNTEWHTLVLADLTDVTTTSTELNVFSGIDTANLNSTKINYLTDVTGPIQAQLDTKMTNALTFHSIWVGGAGNTAQQVSAGVNGSVLTVVSGHPTWQTPPTPGNVSGPVSSTDNAITRWNGTAGDSIQNSGILLDDSNNITFPNGTAIQTATSAGNTMLLRAYDVDGAAYVTFATLTANNTPTFDINTGTTIGSAYIYRVGGTDVSLADGGTGASLANPGADRIMFWDDSAGEVTWLTVGTNLTITGTTISATGGAGGINGPLSATDNAVVRWDTDETTVQNSGVIIDDSNNISGIANLTINAAGALRTATSNTNTLLLQAYDVDGAAYTTFATLTAGNTPTMDLNSSVTIGSSYIYRIGGTDVEVQDGGTNISSYTAGDLIYASGTTVLAKLAIGTDGDVLTISSSLPVWTSGTELAQDAIGNILTDSTTIDFTYNDAAPSITAIVIDNSISNAKIRQSAGLSVIGRSANSTGNVADITASADAQVLRRAGTSIGFGTIGITSMTMNTARLLGRTTASSGIVQEITVGNGLTLSSGAIALGGTLIGSTTIDTTSNYELRVSFPDDGFLQGDSNLFCGPNGVGFSYKTIGSSDGEVVELLAQTDVLTIGASSNSNGYIRINFTSPIGTNPVGYITDTRSSTTGLVYGSDYSSGFIGESLITKNYVLNSKTFVGTQIFAAGTTSIAPLKLQSGTALTTPQNGALEYHSSHLYFTIGSTRYQLDQQGGVTDGDKGDITVSSAGTVWTIDTDAVTPLKISRPRKTVSTSTYIITDSDLGYIIDFDNSTGCVVTIDNTITVSNLYFTANKAAGMTSGNLTFSASSTTLVTVNNELTISEVGGHALWRRIDTSTTWYGAGAFGTALVNSATTNELAKSNGTDLVGSGVFSASSGLLSATSGNINLAASGKINVDAGTNFLDLHADYILFRAGTGASNGGPYLAIEQRTGDFPATSGNNVVLYGQDSSDSTVALSLYTEQVVESIGTFTPSHKYKIRINGTLYWLQLDAV